MSIHWRSLSVGSSLLLGACFSPGPQLTGTTGGPDTDAAATMTATTTMTATGTTDPTTTAPTTSTTNALTTTGTSATTGGSCGSCEPPTPYCSWTDECIGCEQFPDLDMSCGAIDPGTQFCDPGDKGGSGTCVECLSSLDCDQDGQLECDSQTHTCVASDGPCQNHVDCNSGACEVDIGACFPADSRHWYVATGIPCVPGECTVNEPCCAISQAMAGITVAKGAHHIVHVKSGTYSQGFVLAQDQVRVAVLGEDGAEIDLKSPEAAITLGNVLMPLQTIDSKLYVQRLALIGGGTEGARCQSAAFLGLDDVRVRDLETGSSLIAADCTVWARRSHFLRNNGGISLSASKLRLENTILAGTKTTAALTLELLSEMTILYSAVAQQTGNPAPLLSCAEKNGTPPGAVNVRNSAALYTGAGTPVDCPADIDVSYSATTVGSLAALGPGNKTVSPDQIGPTFVDWPGSDLHVTSDGGPLAGLAVWKTGDPLTDIDGELRIGEDGATEVAGADLPVP